MNPTEKLDPESCYRAVKSRDRRFDGVFYTAVRTTGIYCRPSCPARTPGAGQRHVPPERRGRPGRRLPRLQALPPRRDARQPRLGRRRRRRRPRDAADRRRRRRPRGRPRAGRAPRLHPAPPDPAAHRRARRRAAGPGPREAGADRAGADRDHRADLRRHRVRGGLLQRPPVQRHDPRGLRQHAVRPPRSSGRPGHHRHGHHAARRAHAVRRLRAARLPRHPGDPGRGGRGRRLVLPHARAPARHRTGPARDPRRGGAAARRRS